MNMQELRRLEALRNKVKSNKRLGISNTEEGKEYSALNNKYEQDSIKLMNW